MKRFVPILLVLVVCLMAVSPVMASASNYGNPSITVPESGSSGNANCGKEEHTHDETCYDEEGKLICDKEEHTHGEDCWDDEEELPGCGKEEHTHGEACYDKDGKLICGKEEHTHGNACYATGDIPYTGDEMAQQMVLWGAVMAVSLAAIVILLIASRKRNAAR